MDKLPVPKHPGFWLGAVLLWFGVLFYFSSKSDVGIPMLMIKGIDKVQHFGYFFGGGGLLSAFLFFRNPIKPSWRTIILTVFGVMAAVSLIDEYHQTFTPGRSGNDVFDGLADVTGATVGAFVFKAIHRWLR